MDNNIRAQLVQLGFSQGEINAYMYVYTNGGKFSQNALVSYGYSYDQARRLSYMNKILNNGIQINSENDMITHVKKMTGASRQDAKIAVYSENLQNGYGAQNYTDEELIKHLKQTAGLQRKITIQDLAVSNITEVPRVAVVAGIMEPPFTIWNSNNYKGVNSLYRVIDVTNGRITVETGKKPKLEYGHKKAIPGVLEIKGIKQNGKAVVSFDKSVCRLCNRYVIVASLKRPEFHLGCYEIICFEGTRVYVYATNMGTKENVSYRGGTQRVYAYGIFQHDIKSKLEAETQKIYNNLNGVKAKYNEANSSYTVIPSEKTDTLNDDVDF